MEEKDCDNGADYEDLNELEYKEDIDKDCDNCRYECVEPSNYPCSVCNNNAFRSVLMWQPIEDYIDKVCNTCVYGKQDLSKIPCSSCRSFNNWRSKEEPKPTVVDTVNSPEHYTAYPIEVIDMIRLVLTEEQFKGYCLGNEIKYRMRAGIKDKNKTVEDIMKAEKYREWRK